MMYEKNPDESTVENYLLKLVKANKGLTVKLRFLRGWPDRMVLLRGGRVVFFELKRPKGGKYEPLQLRVHQMLRGMGFTVYTCCSKSEVSRALALADDYEPLRGVGDE